MRDLYECGTCGVVTESKDHLCSPREVSGKEDYCGSALETSDMCSTMVQTLEYECGTCGRPAEQAELVCNPAKAR